MTELDPSLRALVDAYRQLQTPAPLAVDEAWRTVAARVQAGAEPTLDATPRTAIAVKLVIVGVAAIAVTAVIAVTAMPSRGTAPTVLATSPPEPTAASTPAPTPALIPAPTPLPVEPIVIGEPRLEAPPAQQTPKPVRPRPRAAPTEPDSLVAELELLRTMRTALRGGEAARALELAARHRRRYPASAFAEERGATEVMALCVQGRAAQAKTKAADFRRRYPSSSFDIDRCDDPTAK